MTWMNLVGPKSDESLMHAGPLLLISEVQRMSLMPDAACFIMPLVNSFFTP